MPNDVNEPASYVHTGLRIQSNLYEEISREAKELGLSKNQYLKLLISIGHKALKDLEFKFLLPKE
jgi:hypothetical protein